MVTDKMSISNQTRDGAGYHSKSKEKEYKSVCEMACKKAMEEIKGGLSAAHAVMTAVTYLEDSQCTNAGIGSNLTLDGTVECDSSIMDGQSLLFGAVGCISDLRNPVQAAYKLLEVQKDGNLPLGRLPPSTLVGEGAKAWMKHQGVPLTEQKHLITEFSKKSYQKYKRKLDAYEERKMKKRIKLHDMEKQPEDNHNMENVTKISEDAITDTVGSVVIDCHGNTAAAVSSGGISLKQPGRLGPAATYGAGCWAYNYKSDDKPGVAVATSGSGEYIVRTLLAKECAACLQQCENASLGVSKAFKDHFLESEYLSNVSEKLAGVLTLREEKDDSSGSSIVELVWGHTTDSMCIGYMSLADEKPNIIMSRLPPESFTGKSFKMEGRHFSIQTLKS